MEHFSIVCGNVRMCRSFGLGWLNMFLNLLRLPSLYVLCIISIYADNCSLSTKERTLVDLCLLLERRSIALCWKHTNCPSLGLWLTNLITCLAWKSYVCKVIKKKPSEFIDIWEDFVKSGDMEEALDVWSYGM